jgi:hypothetical protein
MFTALDPHLTILGCGINEAQASLATASFEANMTATRDAIAALGGDTLIKSCVPSQNAGFLASEDAYWDAIAIYARANGIPFADLFNSSVFGGAYVGALMDDNLHPNNAGYEAIAGFMANAIIP